MNSSNSYQLWFYQLFGLMSWCPWDAPSHSNLLGLGVAVKIFIGSPTCHGYWYILISFIKSQISPDIMDLIFPNILEYQYKNIPYMDNDIPFVWTQKKKKLLTLILWMVEEIVYQSGCLLGFLWNGNDGIIAGSCPSTNWCKISSTADTWQFRSFFCSRTIVWTS